ncbi:MAG: SDR family oxidoreductase [Candidatus Hodarchaeota archaeon]
MKKCRKREEKRRWRNKKSYIFSSPKKFFDIFDSKTYMKILITGTRGYLAHYLIPVLNNHTLFLTSRRADMFIREYKVIPLDLASQKTGTHIRNIAPDLIVNTAAISLPDWAEDHPKETHAANVRVVHNLIEACQYLNIPLVHISTDYVFSGENPPYSEEVRPNPINIYGKTKLEAELLIEQSSIKYLICRIALLFGLKCPHHRPNPFTIWYEKLHRRETIQVSCEQVSNPTYVKDLVVVLKKMIERDLQGVYHVAGPESMSRYEFACQLAEVFDFDPKLIQAVPLVSKRAPRPKNTSLIVDKLKKEVNFQIRGVKAALLDLKSELL